MRVPVVVAAVAAAAAAVAVGVSVVGDDGSDHPGEWDERVVDLVAFVEEERGHAFEHPVAVDFLDEDEYAELAREDPSGLTDEEREELEQTEGLLRALGLVEGDIDLLESANDLSDTATLARYDLEEKRIVVRGTEVTADVKATLVHELTHALQDQVLDVGPLEDDDDEDTTSGERFAARALVEGDAGRVEQAYLQILDDDERAAIEEARSESAEGVEAEDIPVALQALFAAPYALGDGFVALFDAHADVDDAFEDLPSTEEHILDPFAYLDGDEPAEVDTPDTGGAEVLDEGDFGAASLFLVLAERVDVTVAYDAVLGWGGDAYAVFERDGRTCVRIDVTGDDTTETDELAEALSAWVAAAPPGSASAQRDGDVVGFESCDPGTEADLAGSGAGIDALRYAGARTQIAASALATGGTEEQATCFADAVLDSLTLAELATTELTPEIQQRINEAALSCR